MALWLEGANGYAEDLDTSVSGMKSELSVADSVSGAVAQTELQATVDSCPEFRAAYTDASGLESAPAANIALDWAAYVQTFASLDQTCTNGPTAAELAPIVPTTYAGENQALTRLDNDLATLGLQFLPPSG
jgi:hypothetical protein